MPLERLLSVLASGCFSHVSLGHCSIEDAPPLHMPYDVVAALVGSSGSMLTALHNLPLVRLDDQPPAALALLPQLRSLTLRQIWNGPNILRLAQLPASLEQLTLTPAGRPEDIALPLFVGLDRLPSLRQLTFAFYSFGWELGSGDGVGCPIRVPPSFEVCLHRVASLRQRLRQASMCSCARVHAVEIMLRVVHRLPHHNTA